MVDRARRKLVSVLRRAHAGELAAALAYRGHARSLADPAEAAAVLAIALEELDHRRSVSILLDDLGERPRGLRQKVFQCLGSTLGFLCRVSGWLAPMYGAGWIEAGNVREYEDAAVLAVAAGRSDLAPELLRMAEVEWRHERFFRSKVMESGIGRLLPLWAAPHPEDSTGPEIPARVTPRHSPRADRLPDSSPRIRLRRPVSRGIAP